MKRSFRYKVVSLQVILLHNEVVSLHIKSIRCNQLFVLNSLEKFRMKYKRVITSKVSKKALQLSSESTLSCSETTCSETTILQYDNVQERFYQDKAGSSWSR